jgi:3-hydroxyacyl-[acyl-carrier-protein] dehydratase
LNRATFDFHVAADHPSLAGHFPGHPIVPGVLLVDCLFRAVQGLTGREIGRVPRLKFTSPLLPGERAEGSCEYDAARVSFRVATQRHGEPVVLAEGVGIFAPGAPA